MDMGSMDVIIIDKGFDFKHDKRLIYEAFNNLISKNIILHPKIKEAELLNAVKIGYNQKINEVSYFILTDRNIFTDIVGICNHKDMPDQQRRLIATLVLYCYCFGIDIQPGLCLNEYAIENDSSEKAKQEIDAYFSTIFKDDVVSWYELAIGKRKYLRKYKINDQGFNLNYRRESTDFINNYIPTLKIACLCNDNKLTNVQKVVSYMEWVHKYFHRITEMQFSANLIFSGSCPKIKGINSSSYEDALKGCKNHAWDITYLTNWKIEYKDAVNTNQIYLLATQDKMIKDLFNVLYFNDNTLSKDENTLNNFRETFNKKHGRYVFEEFVRIASAKDNRVCGTEKYNEDYAYKLVADLENELSGFYIK